MSALFALLILSAGPWDVVAVPEKVEVRVEAEVAPPAPVPYKGVSGEWWWLDVGDELFYWQPETKKWVRWEAPKANPTQARQDIWQQARDCKT